ncbi:MAG: ABC transporter ATP-binding protein [Streptosporangiales bacterium]
MAMLDVRDLKTRFKTSDGVVKAVDGVSFSLEPGQTLGIAGESGSGKSAAALSIMQLNPQPPCWYPGGEILFEGRNLIGASEKQMRQVRGNEIAMIFQDPMMSLNPVFTIGNQIMETIRIHQHVTKAEARQRTLEVLRDVGIPHPEERVKEYPHQFSGGMRQRAMIAMALSCNPKVLIADEPTTALDVTIQAQILELITKLQDRYETAVIIITHDLGVMAKVADDVLVMYAGRVVEKGTVDDIFYETMMPYSWSLLRSLPRLDMPEGVRLLPIPGTPPSLISLPEGCNFHPRCPFVKQECHQVDPPLEEKRPKHQAACILSVDELEAQKRSLAEELEVEG